MSANELTPMEMSMLKWMTDFFVFSMGTMMVMSNFSAQMLNPSKKNHLVLVDSRQK